MRSKIKVGVGVLVLNQYGQALLGKRTGSHGAGTWAFPGGHLEYLETIKNCAKREVLEETGLRVESLENITFTSCVYPLEDFQSITLFVKAVHIGGILQNKEPHKCEGWQWFTWGMWPKPLFGPLEVLLQEHEKTLAGLCQARV